ncbi:MAG: type II toxin-antitoxin system HigB family toxin [Spirosomataceae bacterium]
MFNVIARRTLLAYIEQYPQASQALKKLYDELAKANFENFNALKEVYRNASIVNDNRVVFNVMGNHYRLVVRVNFERKRMMIKWFGTHQEYDQIEVGSVEHGG